MYHHAVMNTWLFSFQMAELLKLPYGISMDGALFHCIQADSKQFLIYFKLATWSEITSNCTTML